VVAVLDAIGATFLKPCRQYLVVTALGLCQTMFDGFEFPRVV